MDVLIVLVIFAAMLALAFAAFNFFGVKKMPEGTQRMSEIASAIRVGANAFINYEYRVLLIVVLIVAAILAIVTTWHAAVALIHNKHHTFAVDVVDRRLSNAICVVDAAHFLN